MRYNHNIYYIHCVKAIKKPHEWLSHSKIQQKSHQLSLLLSLASFSYFCIVRSSTWPLRNSICPPAVDFPASAANKIFNHWWVNRIDERLIKTEPIRSSRHVNFSIITTSKWKQHLNVKFKWGRNLIQEKDKQSKSTYQHGQWKQHSNVVSSILPSHPLYQLLPEQVFPYLIQTARSTNKLFKHMIVWN